jgi:hypothetical protein
MARTRGRRLELSPVWEPFIPLPWELADAGWCMFRPWECCIVRVGTRAYKTGRLHRLKRLSPEQGENN